MFSKKNPSMNLPRLSNVARVANRAREKERPPHPTDLYFGIVADAMTEDFLRSEIYKLAGSENYIKYYMALILKK
jgi:hypothetical protein